MDPPVTPNNVESEVRAEIESRRADAMQVEALRKKLAEMGNA